MSVTGALILILASLSWAAGSIYAKNVKLPSPAASSGMEMLCGGAVLGLIAAFTGELRGLSVSSFSTTSSVALLYLILVGSIIAYSSYTWLVKHATPAAVGTYAYINPIVAVFLGWLIASEHVTPHELVGAAIILAAVIIITTDSARSAPAAKAAPVSAKRRTA